jgi:hypothetical protein
VKRFARLPFVKQFWVLGLVACWFACASDPKPQVGVGGDGGSTGTRIVIVSDGLLGAATDGGSKPPIGVGSGSPDAAQTDAAGMGSGGAPGVDAMPASCDLVSQNCDQQKACYRKLLNSTSCETPGFAAELTTCATDTICAKGMVCVAGDSGISGCLPICDPQKAVCPDRRVCRPLRGYEPAGYCEP